MRIYLLIVFGVLFLTSCEKKELPVPKHEQGETVIGQTDMGSDYRYQVWFSLLQNRFVFKNMKTDWDLGFEASAEGYHVFLNGSKAMRAYRTNYSSLSEVSDTSGLGNNGKADMPSGRLDSTAFGDWRTDNKVYIIHRGYSETGQIIGFCKLRVISVSETEYVIEYSNLPGQEIHQVRVKKDQNVNFVAWSLNTHAQVAGIEPPRADYDLCFTNYTHVFYDPFQYYQVTGVLSNSYRTRVAVVKDKAFNDLGLNDTLGRNFSTNRNAIGYDWKTFDLQTNLYTVNSKVSYLIMDSRGYYYKFHFIDFYNPQGLKGAPKFEFQRL